MIFITDSTQKVSKMTPSLIYHICLWSLSVFLSNPAFLGLFPAADDLWAASVCYTCVRCIYSGKPRLLIFAGHTVYCDPPASCPWNEATFWGGGGAVTAGLQKGFTLLEMWPWKYIVKVYFSINVYRIPPPPLQTQLLTGQEEFWYCFWPRTVLFRSPQRLTGGV